MSHVVADSSVWVSILTRAAGHARYLPLLAPTHELLVPAIVIYEVVRWSLVHRNELAAEAAKQLLDRHEVVAIDGTIASMAAIMAAEKKLAMADALIAATANIRDAELWTQDADFAGLPRVRLFDRP